MPAGFKFDVTEKQNLHEYCRVESIVRLSGGFNLVTTGLTAGTYVPPLAPLCVDKKKRTATVIRCVRVVEDVAASGTEIKVSKESLVAVGLVLGTGSAGVVVSAVNTSNKSYDVLTLEAAIGEVKSGTVLFEAADVNGTKPVAKANFLNYAHTKVEEGATVTAICQAIEIFESKLMSPVSEKDKETLEGNYVFWT